MLLLAAIPLGIAIGLAVGALGGGGSVLAVPVLVYVLGEDVETATTASLVVVTAAALAGGYGHARAGRVCWRHAALFTAAALPGIVAGTLIGNVAGGRALIAGFALVMLAAAAATWRKATAGQPQGGSAAAPPQGGPAAAAVRLAERPEALPDGSLCPRLRPARDIAAGLVVGLLTGLFGVGGGFVIVPALAVALAFTIRSAIGTSLAIIVATSLLGIAVHLSAGRALDPESTAVMAVACAAGGLAGAHIGGLLPQRTLGRAFAAIVVAVSGYLLASAALLGGPPTA